MRAHPTPSARSATSTSLSVTCGWLRCSSRPSSSSRSARRTRTQPSSSHGSRFSSRGPVPPHLSLSPSLAAPGTVRTRSTRRSRASSRCSRASRTTCTRPTASAPRVSPRAGCMRRGRSSRRCVRRAAAASAVRRRLTSRSSTRQQVSTQRPRRSTRALRRGRRQTAASRRTCGCCKRAATLTMLSGVSAGRCYSKRRSLCPSRRSCGTTSASSTLLPRGTRRHACT
mmetsp:Transcript_53532/g.106541  ORF Transcript_53532/g.106541 Transcript_53532/m.106541 type:complete len:227 (+) Transcript_53532:839-1519(+)